MVLKVFVGELLHCLSGFGMVFCIVALVVFGIMGIFSASHRKLAKEAFDCVFRTVTLRKCESNFDQRMKTKISVGLLKRNKPLGKFVFQHFEAISWVLVIVTIVSLVFVLVGVYNWVAFGNCNGPLGGFCLYNALTQPQALQNLSSLNYSQGIVLGNPSASITVIEFGCFSCPFTKQGEPLVAQLLTEFDGRVKVLWKPFPIPAHAFSRESALAGVCASQQGKFVEFKQRAFARQGEFASRGGVLFNEIAQEIELDQSVFAACLTGSGAVELVEATIAEGEAIGVYGTPTFVLGERFVVGPSDYTALRSLVVTELEGE